MPSENSDTASANALSKPSAPVASAVFSCISPRWIAHCPASALCTDKPNDVGDTVWVFSSSGHNSKLRLISPSCEA